MALTLPMDYGPRAVAHTLRQIPEAVNWARASLGLAAPSDRVLDLVERGVLPAFGQGTVCQKSVREAAAAESAIPRRDEGVERAP